MDQGLIMGPNTGTAAARLIKPGSATLVALASSQTDTVTTSQPALNGASRLQHLLVSLDAVMRERYAFEVFAKDSINFGLMITYRQTWEPKNYQVGDLVSTIPLAPKEIRRYTTKVVTKKSRARKELEDNLHTRRSERNDTSRAESEIIEKASQTSNFKVTAAETIGNDKIYDIKATQEAGGDQSKASQTTKREFRESVVKAAQEYRQQNKVELETASSTETEETTFNEIQNPNDELAVTYLFYELQRTYALSERIQRITPVILVANDVPAPHEIDDAWLIRHDWILRRSILDDSFRPALDYLVKSFVGAEINIRILESNAQAQKAVIEALTQQIQAQNQVLTKDQQDVMNAIRGLGTAEQQQGMINIVSRIFDPINFTGQKDTGAVSAAQAMVDYVKETRDRAERERARLLAELEVANTALQSATDKFSAAVKEHYDNVAAVDRLRVHIKDNILHYMQAIWSYEPPDQRYFRLYNIDAPDIELDTTDVRVPVRRLDPDILDLIEGKRTLSLSIPVPKVDVQTRKLVEIADLDQVLGYKGNYAIFALKKSNFITLNMMQDYLNLDEDLQLRDPDSLGGYSIDELKGLVRCLYERDPAAYNQHRDEIKRILAERMMSTNDTSELVVVPTSSLYIEALVGTHPLLEDFKLIHRAIDIKKAQAEARHAELENLRLAARLANGELGDPDIDKVVVVGDNKNITVDAGQ
ncbi:hypothetical protein Q2941_17470 [Bradyrhizobium sp. UFLA05-153]